MNCKCSLKTKNDRKDYIKAYYEPNFGKGLPDYKVLGWESKEAQNLRFEVLATKVDLKNKKILDVGCGLGNLLEYLNSKKIDVAYTGVDILEVMIESVKQKNLSGEFYCMDIFKQHPFEEQSFDVVYTSGIFNLNMGNNIDFFADALRCFVGLSKSIIAFNLLDKNSPGKEDKYFYYDYEEVSALIKEQFSGIDSIEIIKGYLNNDFTIICRKIDLN